MNFAEEGALLRVRIAGFVGAMGISRTRRSALSGFAACLAIVSIVGCGGKSFSAQLNDICKQYNGKANAIAQPTSPSEISGYLDQVVPLLQSGISKLKAVKPPSDKQGAFNDWTSGLDQELSLSQQAQQQAGSGDNQSALSTLRDVKTTSDQNKPKAQALGAPECAK